MFLDLYMNDNITKDIYDELIKTIVPMTTHAGSVPLKREFLTCSLNSIEYTILMYHRHGHSVTCDTYKWLASSLIEICEGGVISHPHFIDLRDKLLSIPIYML